MHIRHPEHHESKQTYPEEDWLYWYITRVDQKVVHTHLNGNQQGGLCFMQPQKHK